MQLPPFPLWLLLGSYAIVVGGWQAGSGEKSDDISYRAVPILLSPFASIAAEPAAYDTE